MIPTTFPEVLDSTMITTYRACPQKFFREYCQHWKSATPSVHLHAGAAFAKGMETARMAYYAEGMNAEDSVAEGVGALLRAYGDFECPEDSSKSATRMAGALEFHFERYPLDQEMAPPHMIEGKPAIEFNFAEPLPILHPDTGNPLLICGRFDQIVDYAGGVWGFDDKTSSMLGASWPKQWDMRFQFSTYCWGARRAGYPLQGFLVRGISILKRGYDTMQAITYRPEWMLERWEAGMHRTVLDMIRDWKAEQSGPSKIVSLGYFPHNEGDACTSYGGCAFKTVCLSQDPDPWLESGFKQRVWMPLTREES
jgi:hypothetical protein